MTYTIITEHEISVFDMPAGTCRVAVTFDWIEDCGDGWNEPLEVAHAEFCSAKQVGADWLDPFLLQEWAHEWLADLDSLDAILAEDRSTWDEQVAALQARYERQGFKLGAAA